MSAFYNITRTLHQALTELELGLPGLTDNQEFDPPDTGIWARVTILPIPNFSIGKGSLDQDQNSGILQITLFDTDTGGLSAALLQLADSIATEFSHGVQYSYASFDNEVVFIQNTSRSGGFNESGFYQMDFSIEWFAYISRPSQPLVQGALVNFEGPSIVGSFPVTGWDNVGIGGSPYDYTEIVGIAANIKVFPARDALLPGTIGSYVSSNLQGITGSQVWIGYHTAVDWTPSGIQCLASKSNDAGNQRSWEINLQTDGTLDLVTSATGNSTVVVSSTTSPLGFTDGSGGWWCIVFDDSADTASFYKSDESKDTVPTNVTWVPIDEDIAHVTAGIFGGSADVEIGSNNGGAHELFNGSFSRFTVAFGTDRASFPAANCDPGNAVTNNPSFDSGGSTWDLNGNSFVNATDFDCVHTNKVKMEPLAGQNINSPMTIFFVLKILVPAPSQFEYITDRKSDSSRVVALFTNNSLADRYTMQQGVSSITLAEDFTNDMVLVTMQLNGNNTSKLTVGEFSVVGTTGNNSFDFCQLFGINTQAFVWDELIYPSALTDEEIAQNQAFYNSRYDL